MIVGGIVDREVVLILGLGALIAVAMVTGSVGIHRLNSRRP
eukprot:CAMPEP_0179366802 /NCGR_PEP_ID=MMETSP0797-20121207/83248_1 /TAXON_ID=47934 /ORGANISM="Dinophysis acuminata, Strain DAEP01" /LENGTH=40 /DNA_ID= /DNA_START= /DNA_END= /DNA_ORIENTATION=